MNFVTRSIFELQETTLMTARAVAGLFKGPRYLSETITEMDVIGVGSLTIILLTGFFTGGVMTLQTFPTLAFYGATPNYAFQFDDLGHHGLRDQLRDCLKTGDSARAEALLTDEILDQFAVVARWDEVADRMIARYKGIASRLVIYLASHWREVDPKVLERWGEVARAVRKVA